MPIKVEIITSDPKKDLFTTLEAMYKLRYYSKIWHEKYGSQNKINMEYWQRRCDEILEQKIRVCPQEQTDTQKLQPKTNGSI